MQDTGFIFKSQEGKIKPHLAQVSSHSAGFGPSCLQCSIPSWSEP